MASHSYNYRAFWAGFVFFFFLRGMVLLCCWPVLNSWTEVIFSLLPRRLGCGSGPPHPTILIPLMTCMIKKLKGKLFHVAHASTFLCPWHRPVVFSTPCHFPPTRRRPSSARAQTPSSNSPPSAVSSFLNDYFLSFIERIFVDISLWVNSSLFPSFIWFYFPFHALKMFPSF